VKNVGRVLGVAAALWTCLAGGCYTDPSAVSVTAKEEADCSPGVGTCACDTDEIALLDAPEAFELATSAGRCEPGVACRPLLGGGVLMTYCFQSIDPQVTDPEAKKPPFAGCTIARTDMRRFDAYYANAPGDLEVRFCVGSPGLPGELNLWYGQNPNRRLLRLVDHAHYAVEGCYVAHFANVQAQTPAFQEIPEACREACGATGGDACRLDIADDIGDPTKAPVAIVAENSAEPTTARVWVETIRLVDARCRCDADRDCVDPSRPLCEPFASVTACPASEHGVCSTPAD
jgi:hypothetical protein